MNIKEADEELQEYNNSKLAAENTNLKNQLTELLSKLLDRRVISSWSFCNGKADYIFSDELQNELEAERKMNKYFKTRFVQCSTCTDEDKKKCPYYSSTVCKGDKCNIYIDLENLLDNAVGNAVVKGEIK